MKIRGHRLQWGCGLAAVGAVCAALPAGSAGGEPAGEAAPLSLRIAVSETVAGELNGNDASAAMRAWADAVSRQTGVLIVPELCTSAQLAQRVRSRQVDAFSVDILEFERLSAYAAQELVVEEANLSDGQQYLLLVHQASGIRSLAELRGRSLLLYRNRVMCLDRIWLDTLLASARLGPADTFLGRLESNAKLSRVVLPVFFKQTDACLVTSKGFNAMCELNPQLAKQLRALETSPKLITAFLAFHKDSPPDLKKRFLEAIEDLHKSVAGRQALMLFGGTHLVRADVSALHSSFDLLRAYQRLKGKPPAAGQ
jgi:phosphonate transport system substrate-binding protein